MVICPVYNEQDSIRPFFERVSKIRLQLEDQIDLNLVFIDNCSADGTQDNVRSLASKFDWISYLRMSRNNGYQRSLEAGLRNSKADLYVMIDVDCEDPPEMIIDFYREFKSGADVVYGERVDRVEPALIKWLRKQYYHLTRFAADESFNLYMAEFSMISKEVRDAIIQDANTFPFFRASIARVGFVQKAIPYKRHPRTVGQTHYNFFGMVQFGLAGLLTSSTLLLRISAYLFLPWAIILTGLFAAGIINENQSYFWVGIWLSLLYFGSAIAGIAIYVARMYKNTLGRPNYFVDQKKSIVKSFTEST